jgi:hypothetical protein
MSAVLSHAPDIDLISQLQKAHVYVLSAVSDPESLYSHRRVIECKLPALATGFVVPPSRARASVTVGRDP